jgi:hypothetical protein
MARLLSGVLVVLCAACGSYLPVPDLLEKNENGTVMRLSVAAPVREQQVQAVIDLERPNGSPVEVVHVFVYREGAVPAKDVPVERWEWVRGGSLTRTVYADARRR